MIQYIDAHLLGIKLHYSIADFDFLKSFKTNISIMKDREINKLQL